MEQQYKPFPLNNAVLVGNMGTIIKPNGKHAKLSLHSAGYLQCGITINGEVKVMKAHRVIAITWHDNPLNLPEVNHLDGIKTNINADNLEWSTHEDNIKHGRKLGLWSITGRKSGFKHSQTTKDKMRLAKLGKGRECYMGKWIDKPHNKHTELLKMLRSKD